MGLISLSLTVEGEVEALNAYTKLGEEGLIQFPFELQQWGAYYGEVVNRYGVTWQIVKQ